MMMVMVIKDGEMRMARRSGNDDNGIHDDADYYVVMKMMVIMTQTI